MIIALFTSFSSLSFFFFFVTFHTSQLTNTFSQPPSLSCSVASFRESHSAEHITSIPHSRQTHSHSHSPQRTNDTRPLSSLFFNSSCIWISLILHATDTKVSKKNDHLSSTCLRTKIRRQILPENTTTRISNRNNNRSGTNKFAKHSKGNP